MAKRAAKKPADDQACQGDAREEHDWIRQEAGGGGRGLGLRRMNHTVELADTPSIRGMIHKVRHLVETE